MVAHEVTTEPGSASAWAPIDSFVAAWNRHDVGAWQELFVPEADFVVVTGRRLSGWPQIRDLHQEMHAGRFSQSTLAIRHEGLHLLSDRIALAHAPTTITGDRDPDDVPRPARTSRLTFVLEEGQGHWRIRAVHNTNLIPPP